FSGEIRVSVQAMADHSAVELTIRDTGTGIAPEELPRLFERFHRVEGVQARTHEGSGIGLALVQELVKLHGGAIDVRSAFGSGHTFPIRIPTGTAHLPKDRIRASGPLESRSSAATPYVEEALRWLPGSVGSSPLQDANATLAILERTDDSPIPQVPVMP